MTAQELKDLYGNWDREHNSQSESELFWMAVRELEQLEKELASSKTLKSSQKSKNDLLPDVSNNEVAVCPECGCNKTTIVNDETWCLNKLCGAEWQTDC